MLAANFSDPENARTIFLAAGGLIVLAAALVAGTVWWWRTSAVEHPVLGPLEVMGTKPFLAGDSDARREILGSLRHADSADDDDLVLNESFDEVFPDGVGAPLVTEAEAPVASRSPVAPSFDPFDPFDPFDGDLAGDRNGIGNGASDLDALADDIWGAAPGSTTRVGEVPRTVDPLLKPDDNW